jgi:phosphoribosylformylglycinamidine (FGAM) synthase-like amidotransferase family enzyme
MEGNYFCDDATLQQLEQQQRIAFRYCEPDGSVTAAANPNGSRSNIAGVLNEGRNVLGMMPHPDRSSEPILGSSDGKRIFDSMIAALTARV